MRVKAEFLSLIIDDLKYIFEHWEETMPIGHGHNLSDLIQRDMKQRFAELRKELMNRVAQSETPKEAVDAQVLLLGLHLFYQYVEGEEFITPLEDLEQNDE